MVDTLLIKRRTSGAPGAPGALQNGELAFNELNNTLYYGKVSSIVPIGGSGSFLPLIGGTLTGALTLAADPAGLLEAATKQYVDGKVGGTGYLPLTGGTLSGPGNLIVGGTLSSIGAFTAVTSLSPATLTADTRGNIGIGFVPPALTATSNTANGGGWIFTHGLTANNRAANLYYDGTGWRYSRASGGWICGMDPAGIVAWSSAPNGAVDAVATLTNRMSLDKAGLLTVTGSILSNSIRSNNGRMWSYSVGGNPSVMVWDGNIGAAGMFMSSGSLLLYFGQMDGTGAYNGNWYGYFDNSGNFTGRANISTGSTLTGGWIRSTGGIMADSGAFYVANNTNYYLARDPGNGYWNFVENSQWNLTIRPSGETITRTTAYAQQFVAQSGLGIQYSAFTGYWFAFGWDGNLNCYVNGGYQGGIAMQGWVNGSFVTRRNAYALGFDYTDRWYMAANDTATWFYCAVDTTAPSDERIKSNIQPTKVDALNLLCAIPVDEMSINADIIGYWKSKSGDEKTEDERAAIRASATAQYIPIGVVAQKLKVIIPELVQIGDIRPPLKTDPDSPIPEDMHYLKTADFWPYFLRAIQQLNIRLVEVEAALPPGA